MPADSSSVVIPAIHNGSSLSCMRSLGRRDVHTIGVASDRSAPSIHSAYCSESRIVPHPSGDFDGYTDELRAIAKRSDVRTIVPLREADIYALSTYRDDFASHIATPWPERDTVRGAQDRQSLLTLADDVGVRVPRWAPLREWNDWSAERVIKPRYSFLVEDEVYFPTVQVTTAREPPDVADIAAEMGHEPLVQEFVDGGEYGYFALYDRGDPIAEFQHRRIRSYKASGGASVFREAVQLPTLADAGRAILDALDWHGPAMVEFKRDAETGEFVLMEVNPRFWGSLSLPVHAGVDFPWLYYQLANGSRIDEQPTYRAGVGCHELVGELIYLYDVLTGDYEHLELPPVSRECVRILASLASHRQFDYVSSNDPTPFLRSVVNVLGEGWRRMG